jgi:predicted RNase H-like HicB family nuclease
MRYAVVLHKDKDSVFGVTVPDVPGCFSAGETVDEALENAREAIFAHLELVVQDGADVPVAGDIEAYRARPDYADGIWAFVDANVEELMGPAERINITVPQRALQKIDAAAGKLGSSRSELMTKASIDYIAKHMPVPVVAAAKSKKTGRSAKGR